MEDHQTQNPCISLKNISKSYGKKEIIKNITLEVYPNEIVGLLGPSGSGKTTLVRQIVGIESPSKGEVFVLNQRMPMLSMMKNIGYMAQSDALYGELTAYENLDFFAAIYGLKGKHRKRRINDVMEIVGLKDSMKKTVHSFSGGMKRRLSLAIALLHFPKVLILDEPTVGIDPILRKSIWEELHRLCDYGTSILITTHVMDEAEKCNRLAMLREGRVIAKGSPASLKEKVGCHTIEEAFLAFGGVRE